MSASTARCSIDVQDVFGPIVASSCQRGFDFTLLFEESILTIVPLGIAVLVAVVRIFTLSNSAAKVRRSWFFMLKLVLNPFLLAFCTPVSLVYHGTDPSFKLAFTAYITLQAILLALWADPDTPTTKMTVVTAALTVASFTVLLYVSCLEHVRSIPPSTLMAVYFGVTCLLDVARLRTLFCIPGYHTIATVYMSSFFVKLGILSLELTEKRYLLLPYWQDASPEATSGIYNRALSIWLNPLFLKGFSNVLTIDFLPSLDAEILSASRPTSLLEKWDAADKSKKNALFWTFVFHYKWAMLSAALPKLIYSTFIFTEPLLLQSVLDFIADPVGPNTKNVAYGLTVAYAIVHIGKAMSLALHGVLKNRVCALFRGSLITFIFGKTLRLSATANSDAGAITLMSSDIDRIDASLYILIEIYVSVVELGLALWLLYRLLGLSIVASVIVAASCLVVGTPLASAAGKAHQPWLEAIERRLAATTKALGAMKAIKMTGLTDVVYSIVESLRSSEIRSSHRHRILSVAQYGASYTSVFFVPVVGLAAYTLQAKANGTQALTEGVAFAALSLFVLLDDPLGTLLYGADDISTVITSFSRIQEHMLSEEQKDPRISRGNGDSVHGVRQRSSHQTREEPFKDVEVATLEPETLESGVSIHVEDASAGYAPDKLVLEGLNLDIPRCKTTMIVGPVGSGKSTMLKLLLGELPETSGSVATSFSTSAFCPQSPWITWGTIQSNILGMSAWDKSWYNTVVRACALSADFDELPDGDETKTGTRGARLSGGQQMRIVTLYSRNPVLVLDDVLTGLDRATEASILDAVFGPHGLLRQSNSTVMLATNSVNHLHYADHVIVLGKDGKIAEQGTMDSVLATGGYVQRLAGQPRSTVVQPDEEISDETLKELGLLDEDKETDSNNQAGDFSVYSYYIGVAGNGTFLLYLVICACGIAGFSLPSIWLQWWTNANAVYPNEDLGYWLGVYTTMAVIGILGCLVSDWVLIMVLIPKTSREFHRILLKTTMRAKISFLTSTAAGNIANRFSQDLDLVDDDLPNALEGVIIQAINSVTRAALVATGSGYVAAVLPICALLVYLLQFYYLRTSRQLRLLDIEAKAPLFSQFLETGSGVSCIRAYGWTQDYMERSYTILDDSQKPFYLLKSIQRWLNLVLDLLVAGISILLVALATNIRGSSTGFLGVALFSVVDFSSSLQGLISRWTKLEMSIGAITRIRSYVLTTESEDLDGETFNVPESWPEKGAIAFKGISASYDPSLDPILKKISLEVAPGEKVAICGRTGSGKSSLIATLLRMLELNDGSINIDGIDISTIPRQQVRRRLNTLPQEPFFLNGSVRENVDPLYVANDARIIGALEAVHLWSVLETRGGLDASLSEDELSHGQRQLICLARAIVRPSKIVVMDEATSSIDSDTDELMQRVIREEFKGHTIITIAHKLQTVLDYDRVVLMDKGQIIECGNPQELLATPDSSFHALYMSMGREGERSGARTRASDETRT